MAKQRVFGLDIMRFAAIMTVLIDHLYWIVGIPVSIDKFQKFSIDGVSIFFTLSGFLIGNILFRELSSENLSSKTLINFWKARWWRTLPAYYFILFILVFRFIYLNQFEFREILPYFFFIQNLHTGKLPFFGASWSLTIEEWFYITAPILFLIVAKYWNLKKGSPYIIALYFISATLLRIYKIHINNYKNILDYAFGIQQALPTRIDAVMFGVLGAYLNFYKLKIWTNYRKIFFAIGIIGFLTQQAIVYWDGPQLTYYLEYFFKPMELFFSLCMIPYLSTIKTGKGMIARFISFTALISYSIYLVHATIYSAFFIPWLPADFRIRIIVYFIVSFGIGYLNYLVIERWGIRQRNKQRKNLLEPKTII